MSATQIRRLSHQHEAILDWLLARPEADFGECAAAFGFSRSWLSIIVRSDLFQAELRRRRTEMEALQAAQNTAKLTRLLDKSIGATERLLESPMVDGKTAVSATELALRALGMIDNKAPQAAPSVRNTQINIGAAVDPATLAEAQRLLTLVNKPPALGSEHENVIPLPSP